MIYDIRKQIHDLRLYQQISISIHLLQTGKQTKTDMGNDQPVQTDIGALPELTEDEQYQFRVGLRKFNKCIPISPNCSLVR